MQANRKQFNTYLSRMIKKARLKFVIVYDTWDQVKLA